jgi:type I restriction enzyme R subunit
MNETEADGRANRIDPVLRDAGWGVLDRSHIRRELICPGRILAGGRRGTALSADYVMCFRRQEFTPTGRTSGSG